MTLEQRGHVSSSSRFSITFWMSIFPFVQGASLIVRICFTPRKLQLKFNRQKPLVMTNIYSCGSWGSTVQALIHFQNNQRFLDHRYFENCGIYLFFRFSVDERLYIRESKHFFSCLLDRDCHAFSNCLRLSFQ